MNAVAMFLQQMQLPVKEGAQVKSSSGSEKHVLFQSLLDGNLTEDMLQKEQGQEDEENKEGTTPFPFSLKLLMNQVTTDEAWNQNISQMVDREWMNEALTAAASGETEGNQPNLSDDVADIVKAPPDMDLTAWTEAYQSFMQMFQEVQTILEKLSSAPANAEQAAPKLLALLQQWVKTASSPAGQKGMEKALNSLLQEETKEHVNLDCLTSISLLACCTSD